MLALATGLLWHTGTGADAETADEEADEQAEEESRGSIPLGWMVHGLLSLKSRFGRLFARRRAAGISFRRDTATAKAGRLEPHFGDYQKALRDLEHEAIDL